MSVWHPEDWDGEITPEVRDRVAAMSGAGGPEPVVVMVSPAFEAGRALLGALADLKVEAGDLVPPVVASGDRLSALLDRHMGQGVGRLVMSARLRDPEAIRGVLVLPATIEIHAVRPEPAEDATWCACILDLAGRRLHMSDDGGVTWRSSNLVAQPR